MDKPEFIAEFQKRRQLAIRATKKTRGWIVLFFLGLVTLLQDLVPWLPFFICGIALIGFFFSATLSRDKLKCPSCGQLAIDTGKDYSEAIPDISICHHCKTRLK